MRRIRTMLLAGLCLVALSLAANGWCCLRLADRPGAHADQPVAQLHRRTRTRPSLQRARALLGPPPSGGRWHSGIWAGGDIARTNRVKAFGTWRETPVDAAIQYPERMTWQAIHDSHWHVATYADFDGTLVYGLPMLPERGSGNFGSIVSGEHDWVYRKVARDLVTEGHGRSIVRIGWEANGDWFPWGATTETAPQYVLAYRHIVGVLHSVAPDLVIDFDISCGAPLPGQQDRLAALTELYPGDDVVDLVGCDTYDWYNTKAQNEVTWWAAIRPADRVGIADVADFARPTARASLSRNGDWPARPKEGWATTRFMSPRCGRSSRPTRTCWCWRATSANRTPQ